MTIGTGLAPIPGPGEEAEATVASLLPRIMWPSLERGGKQNPRDWVPADLDYFPDQMLINERYQRPEGECHSPLFRESVKRAINRVFVVDAYLFNGGPRALDEVLSWFPNEFEAPDVKIVCEGVGQKLSEAEVKGKFTDRERDINERLGPTGRAKTTLKLKLDFKPLSSPQVHDRFAIVDDELWHFGATVGGIHPSVSAVSRGWSATATRATAFCKLVWQQHGGHMRQRR